MRGLAVLLTAALLQGCAGQVRLSVAHWSHHVTSDDITNERHQMIGVSHRGVFAGTFKNSYGHRSVAVGVTTPIGPKRRDWQGYGRLGAVHGYRSCFGDKGKQARVCPFLQAGARYERYAVQPGVAVFGDAILPTVDYVWRRP